MMTPLPLDTRVQPRIRASFTHASPWESTRNWSFWPPWVSSSVSCRRKKGYEQKLQGITLAKLQCNNFPTQIKETTEPHSFLLNTKIVPRSSLQILSVSLSSLVLTIVRMVSGLRTSPRMKWLATISSASFSWPRNSSGDRSEVFTGAKIVKSEAVKEI